MKLILFISIITIQLQLIKAQNSSQSACCVKSEIEYFCQDGYSCCDCNQCCSSTEICIKSQCMSVLLVIFGPASLILFGISLWLNYKMSNKEKQYKKDLEKLSQSDNQINLPNQNYFNEEECKDPKISNENSNINNQKSNKDEIKPIIISHNVNRTQDDSLSSLKDLKQPLLIEKDDAIVSDNKINKILDNNQEQQNNDKQFEVQDKVISALKKYN